MFLSKNMEYEDSFNGPSEASANYTSTHVLCLETNKL